MNQGIQRIQQFKLIVHPKCENTIIELSNYSYAKDKNGKAINKPIDDYNHLLDALRYSIQSLDNEKKAKVFSGRGLNI